MKRPEVGDAVTGEYFDVPFSGIVTQVDPNWSVGSGGAINVYIKLDTEIVAPGGPRQTLCMLRINRRAADYVGKCGGLRLVPPTADQS